MKRVITIHGINTAGDWQRELQSVLEPHFSCISITYPHYRYFGALRLILEPWILFAGVLVLATLYMSRLIQTSWFTWSLCVGGLLVIAHLGASFRRRAVAKYVKEEIDKHRGPGERPHLIAHSFGTFLAGTLMMRYSDLRFDAVILAGCTLPTSYNWSRLKTGYVSPRIRNEVARSDWVLRTAAVFRWIIRGMGNAGIYGFRARGVHSIATPDSQCSIRGCNGRSGVHNVRVPFGHSDHFVGRGHTETFWLPFLWNIDGAEYRHFLEMCRLAADLTKARDWQRLEPVERALTETRWDWADGETLAEFVERQVRAEFGSVSKGRLPADLAGTVSRVIANLWETVADATDKRRTESGENLAVLFPRIAVAKAVDSIVKVSSISKKQKGSGPKV
jgi:pimeloyl-ACP methyl ester carboxylesterase